MEDKIKQPDINAWYWYWNKEGLRPNPVMIITYARKRWKEYTIAKVKEIIELTGYEAKQRSEISNWKTRQLPKIRIGREVLYLLNSPSVKLPKRNKQSETPTSKIPGT
jgi:hypothetical protein